MTLTVLLIFGAIVVIVGFVMLAVHAFGASLWWGAGLLAAQLVPSFLGADILMSAGIAELAVLAFAASHWKEAKVGFMFYVIGTIMVLPGLPAALHRLERWKPGTVDVTRHHVQPSSGSLADRHRAAQPARQPARPYVPAPQPAAVHAATTPMTDQKPKAAAVEKPLFETPAIAQVYVVNATKKYYPLDCKAARPETGYRMAKSQAVRQGYTLAAECSR